MTTGNNLHSARTERDRAEPRARARRTRGAFRLLAQIAAAVVLQTGCASSTDSKATEARSVPREPSRLAVDDVATRMRSSGLVVFDANGKELFDRGHVPGATWIAYDSFPPEALPADKSAAIVFYCFNEQCGASPIAAARAVRLGHTNVFLMPPGISGWKASGKAVESSPN
jgi:rhodanese-related sulfurtransferase